MYRVYMTGKNEFSVFNVQNHTIVLKQASFADSYNYLNNKLCLSKTELVKGFEGLIDNFHNTIEFGKLGSFLYTRFIDFDSV